MKMQRRCKPLDLGWETETGGRLSLKPEWFETHLHLVGPPGSGKTRLLLWIFEYLARIPKATIVLLNPKGALGRMARDWAIAHGQGDRLAWFHASDPRVPGYNPLHPNGLRVATHAKAVREAIRSAWGQSSFDETPQLARLLYLALAVSLALHRSLLDALQLLRSGPAGSQFRRDVLYSLANGAARGEPELLRFLVDTLAWFDSLNDKRQEELAASSLARLESFVCDPVVSRILTQSRCLNMGDLIANHKIFLVNLEIGRPLRIDDVKLLGRFIVNDVVNHVQNRPNPDEPVYLLIDEVQNFATRDLCTVLDMGRELGLHCVLAHQHLGQLRDEDNYVYSSVRGCAQTKFYFGGLPIEDLDILVRDACIGQYNPYKVKDELKALTLIPIESRRDVVTEARTVGVSAATAKGTSSAKSLVHARGVSKSNSKSTTDGQSSGSSSSSGWTTGSQWGTGSGETELPNGDIIESSHDTDGTSESYVDSQTDTESETHSKTEGLSRGVQKSRAFGRSNSHQESRSLGVTASTARSVATSPFYEYKKEERVSSRTFETEQEFLTTMIQKVQGQPQAHVFVKVPGKPGRFVRLPRVKTPLISSTTRAHGLKRMYEQPFYPTAEETQPSDKATPALPANVTDKTFPTDEPSHEDESFTCKEVTLKPPPKPRKKKR